MITNYKFLTLKNKLKVIIVNDVEADMSAACMTIHTVIEMIP